VKKTSASSSRIPEKDLASPDVHDKTQHGGPSSCTICAEQELSDLLGVENELKRIECYKISRLGASTVASMVVFERGNPAKSAYRHFPVRSSASDEDNGFKSISELLHRRMSCLTPHLPTGVIIRRATRKEARKFYAICVALDRWIDEWNDGSVVFVAVRDEEIVAGAREWISSEGRSTIVDVWVREDERGARLGLALMSRTIYAISAQEVHIDCVPSLEPYYAELGFKKIDRTQTPDILEPDELPDSIVMALNKSESDVSSWSYATPDLIVLYGGKSLLSAVLDNVKLTDSTHIVGFGRQIELLIRPSGRSVVKHPPKTRKAGRGKGDVSPRNNKIHRNGIRYSFDIIRLPESSDAFHLVMRLRDEANRFAYEGASKLR
jgi:predicted GNAT family N-acyltransferase